MVLWWDKYLVEEKFKLDKNINMQSLHWIQSSANLDKEWKILRSKKGTFNWTRCIDWIISLKDTWECQQNKAKGRVFFKWQSMMRMIMVMQIMIPMMIQMTMIMMMMTIIAIASSSHWNVLAAGPESYLTSPRPAGGSHFSLSKPPPCRRHHRHYTWDGMGCFAQLNNCWWLMFEVNPIHRLSTASN